MKFMILAAEYCDMVSMTVRTREDLDLKINDYIVTVGGRRLYQITGKFFCHTIFSGKKYIIPIESITASLFNFLMSSLPDAAHDMSTVRSVAELFLILALANYDGAYAQGLQSFSIWYR